jgi:hypothetical protein
VDAEFFAFAQFQEPALGLPTGLGAFALHYSGILALEKAYAIGCPGVRIGTRHS